MTKKNVKEKLIISVDFTEVLKSQLEIDVENLCVDQYSKAVEKLDKKFNDLRDKYVDKIVDAIIEKLENNKHYKELKKIDKLKVS